MLLNKAHCKNQEFSTEQNMNELIYEIIMNFIKSYAFLLS